MMFDRIKSIFRRTKPLEAIRGGWDGLTDNRLTKVQFELATGNSINSDLAAYGDSLRKRCAFIARHPMIDDVIETHIADCIGEDGPLLQCVTANAEYKKTFEAAWWDWWMDCDLNGQLPGPDMMRMWWRSLFVNGNFLFQFTNRDDAEGVKLAINNISPERLETPFNRTTDYYTVLGVKRDKYGKPLAYYVRRPETNTGIVPQEWDELPAADMIHFFKVCEVGQAQGVPILAPILGSIADLRQFDGYVLEAAKMAAMLGVLLKASNFNTQPQTVDTSTMADIESGMIATLPPGYEPFQINPQQPGANYIDYRHDLQRDAGRIIGMPLMKVNKDASKHNYSSARYDDQQYNRRNTTFEGAIGRRVLTPIVRKWMVEARLKGIIPPATPPDMYFEWIWPKPVHVDPKKEADAQEVRLRIGVSNRAMECAANGDDSADVLNQCIAEKPLLEQAGIGQIPQQKEPPNANSEDGKDEDIGKSASGE
jgi:lambda family phage portal protein